MSALLAMLVLMGQPGAVLRAPPFVLRVDSAEHIALQWVAHRA